MMSARRKRLFKGIHAKQNVVPVIARGSHWYEFQEKKGLVGSTVAKLCEKELWLLRGASHVRECRR